MPSNLSSRIRDNALRLGFSKLGIAPAGPLPQEARFEKWLQEGFHGEMRYMQRQIQKRRRPDLVFPDVRSLLVLGCNYYTGYEFEESPLKGKIGRYAQGDDYHFLLKQRLKKLLNQIQCLEPSAEGICYVDTGPVMEKAWGAQTSLGWMGKNTSLISRERGSWFFIGVILLNIELEYDARENDYCGRCTRCIDVCPTGAIVSPYVLDARLCISYLTIELRNAIPLSLRPLVGNRIFGCDDCQEVCPWNRFATATTDRDFLPRKENLAPDLVSLARITAEQFQSRFRNSPILRATRDGFVRNVAVALGNTGSSEVVSVLSETLHDDSALVRSHAAWALGRIATPHALELLDSALKAEDNGAVREEIIVALAKN